MKKKNIFKWTTYNVLAVKVLKKYREVSLEIKNMQSIQMPEEDSTSKFVNFHKLLEVFSVI